MTKRSIAFLLAMSMLFALFVPVAFVFAKEEGLSVLRDGSYTEELTINFDEKTVITAETAEAEPESWQWQVLIDSENEIWADIFDKKSPECEVSYALVRSAIENSGRAVLRCKAFYDGEWNFSNNVEVNVTFEEKIPEETEAELILVSGIEVIEGEESFEVMTDSAAYTAPNLFADGENEYVTVTIRYLDYDDFTDEPKVESQIYQDYVARILKGTSFHQDVVSPTYIGFAPVYDGDGDGIYDEDASVLQLNYASVNENIEIIVLYKAIEVNFAIRYFFQNVNDDLYTEDVSKYYTGKAETGTILDDDFLKGQAGDTTGFSKMYHIPEAVAADGSTVFECYYDREYHLLTFDLDGGYGVDPIYARYGTPFVINDPVRHGYSFKGWDLLDEEGNGDGVADTLPSKIPAEDQRYRAIWGSVYTYYTVVGWIERDGKKEYIGSYTEEAKSGTTVSIDESDIDINDFTLCVPEEHRYIEFKEADENVLVEGDGSSVLNVYYQYKEYTLRFYYAMENTVNRTYHIVGGTSYYFGSWAKKGPYGIDTDDEIALLNEYATGDWRGHVGEVDELPQLNTEGKSRNYTKGSDTSTSKNYKYYYIEFKARYNDNISELWPCSVFQPVTRLNNKQTNGWIGDEAFVSAWNGEHNVYYSQHYDNETIKGKYEKLDYQLLWDNCGEHNFEESRTVCYLCFWENGANISWNVPELYRYNIYVEVTKGMDTTGLEIKEYGEKSYYLKDSYDTCDNSTVAEQTAVALEGYTYIGRDYAEITDLTDDEKSLYSEAWDVYFYYDRETGNTVTFMSNGETAKRDGVEVEAEDYKYGEEIKLFEPDYPSNLEPDAYEFAGWYTTAGCYDGSEFTEGTTMPANSVILYAKWAPLTHTVRFFESYDDMVAFEADPESGTPYTYRVFEDITHGEYLGATVEEPVKEAENDEAIIFGGWFFMENGEQKAFEVLNFPIRRDMNIFADWGSHSPKPYKISYVLESDPTKKVADDTEGYAYAGTTKTFTAKAGQPYNQLYSDYNTGFFPTISSHSITIKHEPDPENLVYNTHTFYYVEAADINYTINYINSETNVIMDSEIKTTTEAVVTERFRVYPDMIPDAFYKRLVISVEKDKNGNWVGTEDNVINFYYTPNTKSAYYAVHFMLEKLDYTPEEEAKGFDINGDGIYEESGTHIEGIGDVGKDILINTNDFSFPGFELVEDNGIEVSDEEETVESVDDDGNFKITVTESGTELYIFYKRKSYDYTVHYYEYNTTTPCNGTASLTGTEKYGRTISLDAETIEGYTCVSASPQSLLIRETEDGKKNEIIFYYSLTQYTVQYYAVPPEGGLLSSTLEVISGTGDFTGSLPTANEGYEFEGWYIDAACAVPVTTGQGELNAETGLFKPYKNEMTANGENIFYAKFKEKTGPITIIRENASDDDRVYVYEIKDEEGNIINVTVVGNGSGNGSVTVYGLLFGEYTITQIGGWSWRNGEEVKTADHASIEGTVVVFDGAETNTKWLGGNSGRLQNIFTEP